MTINLTPEQERRIQAVIRRGAYESVEEVVEAALTAVEQLTVPGFAGTQQELDTLLAEGLASKQLAEDEFWSSVGKQTNAMLAEHKTSPRSSRFCIGKLPAMMSCRRFATISYDKSYGGRRSFPGCRPAHRSLVTPGSSCNVASCIETLSSIAEF